MKVRTLVHPEQFAGIMALITGEREDGTKFCDPKRWPAWAEPELYFTSQAHKRDLSTGEPLTGGKRTP